ncbi:Chemotaxis protein CheZ [Methylorubrum thiocyanatum]
MSSSRSLTPQDASQYDAIEDAVRETERGRWFLAEYARRNRNADTEVLLDAIRRIENVVSTTDRPDDVGRFRGDLMEMADAIARTRAEVAALSAPDQGESRLTVASEALDAIVRATERATSDILSAAEEVQEAAWTLRETGADSEMCDALDRHATQIYTACSFQDLTAQRTSRVVHTLRYLENRIASMIGIWGNPDDAVPSLDERARAEAAAALDQSDVDRFLDMEGPVPAPARAPLPPLPSVTLDDDLAFLPDAPERDEPVRAEEAVAVSSPAMLLAAAIAADLAALERSSQVSGSDANAVEAEPIVAMGSEEAGTVFEAASGGEVTAEAEEALEEASEEAQFKEIPVEEALEAAPEIDGAEEIEDVAGREEPAQDEPSDAAADVTLLAEPEATMPVAEPLVVAPVALIDEDDLALAFPDLDTLSIEEKIALFA